jgi:hypothetical protein
LTRSGQVAGFLIGLVLLLTFWDPLTLLVCKYFVDSVSYGFSGAKTRLLLLWFLALIWLSWLGSPWKKKWNLLYVIALVALQSVAVINQLIYSLKYHLDPVRRTLLAAQGQFTSTNLFHIHVAKVPAALISQYSGEGIDVGSPVLHLFPVWWMVFHSVLFLGVAFLSFMLVHERQKSWGWGKTVSLALSVFILTIGGIDGGPLASSTLAALPFLGGFLFGKKGGQIGAVLLAFGLCLSLGHGGPTYLFRAAQSVSTTAAALALPLLLGQSGVALRRFRIPVVVLCLITVVAFPYWKFSNYRYFKRPPHTMATLDYGFTRVEPGQIVTVISPFDLEGRAPDLVEIQGHTEARRLSIYRLRTLRETTFLGLSRQLGVPLFRSAFSVDPDPVQVEISGPFELPLPEQTLKNPTVQSFELETSAGHSRLVLNLIPGGSVNVAVDVLPDDLIICYEIKRLLGD